jgi:hypothetical protein
VAALVCGERLMAGAIGGPFPLEVRRVPPAPGSIPFLAAPRTYFLSARCALMAVAEAGKFRRVWLPSYLCPSLFEPFRRLEVRFYPVSARLAVADASWVREIEPHDLVIAIHYFGFELDSFPRALVAAAGARLVEDSSQALFRSQWTETYAAVFSPRKFIGLPDGGVITVSADGARTLAAPPPEWWLDALQVRMRRDADRFRSFQTVEATIPLGSYRASDLAVAMLENGTDYSLIRQTRRANYEILLSRLRDFAIFDSLPDDCVPLGFPVRVPAERRDAILNFLYANSVYAPVHWRIAEAVPARLRESHVLARSILTMIVDQRYGPEDMHRQAALFLEAACA